MAPNRSESRRGQSQTNGSASGRRTPRQKDLLWPASIDAPAPGKGRRKPHVTAPDDEGLSLPGFPAALPKAPPPAEDQDVREPEIPGLLSSRQVATIFGRDPRTLRRWVRNGRLTAIKVGGALFFLASEIRGLIDGQLAKSIARKTVPRPSGQPVRSDYETSSTTLECRTVSGRR
jgi:hypothetical protein